MSRPPHCGAAGCDARTRLRELPDGRMARCPRCHPLSPEAQAYAARTQAAERDLDPDWAASAWSALIIAAQAGTPFTAADLRPRCAEPNHPNHWGLLFRKAARSGLITEVGTTRSEVGSRRGGLVRTWQGATASARARHLTSV